MPENRTPETKKRRAPKTAFKPGVSGNPGGRPKALKEVQELARVHTESAIKALADILTDSPDDKARIAAAEALLNRAWGKPSQAVELSGKDGEPIKNEVRHVPSPEQLAAILRILAGTAPTTEPDAARGSDAGANAETE